MSNNHALPDLGVCLHASALSAPGHCPVQAGAATRLLWVLLLLLAGECQGQARLSYPDLNTSGTCPPGAVCPDAVKVTKPALVTDAGTAGTPAPPAVAPQQTAPAGEESSEFQDFVAASLGSRLPLFGYNLFAQVPSTFAPVDRIPVTAEYVIGPGDEVLVRAWGTIDLDARQVVDRSGHIYLPKIGNVQVAGLKFYQLQDYLKSAIGHVFKNFDLNANLGQLRSIQVFVVGQARRPGTYTVSSLSTLVNTLFASGGPSAKGSMRHIQLKRNNVVVTEFDLYDLLLKGDKSKDAVLLPGDVIFIPPVGALVAISGSVNAPAIYELRSASTLGELLQLAGGLTNVADGQKVTVERIYDRAVRRVEEFSLDASAAARPLQDGDLVRILQLSPRFENAVTLRGNVAWPGRYPWRPGMRVRHLIPTRETLITRDYWSRQNAAGGNKELRGAPEINWEYAVIDRMQPDDLTTRLIPFNLGQAIADENSAANLELLAGDVITIFSQADLRIPLQQQNKFVYLEGEFRHAGVYRVEPGETLRHLAARVGGTTPEAYLFGAQFTRQSTKAEQRKTLDEMIRQLEQELQHSAAAEAAKASSAQESTAARLKLENDRMLIEKMKQLEPTGRIVLELPPDAASVDQLPDIVLEEGDRLFVPYRSPSVTVAGEVYNGGTFLHNGRKTVRDYLRQAGGATRHGDSGKMFVLRADGSVLPRRADWWGAGFENRRLMPGDSIIVPIHFPTSSFIHELKDWTQIFSQLALGVAAVRVLDRP